MPEEKVKIVELYFPNMSDGSVISYEVGKAGVTRIEEMSYSPEPYCSRWYYNVYKENDLIARMDSFSIVLYEES